jgi:hypothetical protein
MNLFARVLVIFFSFLAASFAGGFVIVLAVLFPAWSMLELGPIDNGFFAVATTIGFVFVTGFALVPAAAAAAVAETFAIRSGLFYAAAGAAIGFIAYASLGGVDIAALGVDGFTRRETEIAVAAGIVAGLVYWLLAGRSAGRWRESPPASPS